MRVFVLSTGRCGSTAFAKACEHITNYRSGHESASKWLGRKRLSFPDNYIEVDNRLSWFLGRLDLKHRQWTNAGEDIFYVHLTRDREGVAQSYAKRFDHGIIWAYRECILMGAKDTEDHLAVARDYVDTVTANIEFFLENKTQVMDVRIENIGADFRYFWRNVGAKGDLDAALAEFDVGHNASGSRNDVEDKRPRR